MSVVSSGFSPHHDFTGNENYSGHQAICAEGWKCREYETVITNVISDKCTLLGVQSKQYERFHVNVLKSISHYKQECNDSVTKTGLTRIDLKI